MTDRRSAGRSLEEAVVAALAGGADWVQVRERDLEGAPLLALVDRLVALVHELSATPDRAAAQEPREAPPPVDRSGPEAQRLPAPEARRVLVNRRLDVALAAGAGGVHLGFDAVDPEAARRLLGPGALVGVSCHSPEEVERTAAAGADYAHLAPIFDPFSKARERPALGIEALTRAARAGIPVLAQGGIDPARARAALAAGAAGVAVTGAVLAAPDPRAATAALRRALDAS